MKKIDEFIEQERTFRILIKKLLNHECPAVKSCLGDGSCINCWYEYLNREVKKIEKH